MKLIDRWKSENIGFTWNGTRKEFEKQEHLTLDHRNGDIFYYKNSRGTTVVYDDETKTYYFE